jgi:hypothetical protein
MSFSKGESDSSHPNIGHELKQIRSPGAQAPRQHPSKSNALCSNMIEDHIRLCYWVGVEQRERERERERRREYTAFWEPLTGYAR